VLPVAVDGFKGMEFTVTVNESDETLLPQEFIPITLIFTVPA